MAAERIGQGRGILVLGALAVVLLLVLGTAGWRMTRAAHGNDANPVRAVATTGTSTAPTRGVNPTDARRTPAGTPEPSPSEVGTIRRITTLGDSVAVGSTCDCEVFPDLVARAVSRQAGGRVTATNDAVDGATTGDVITALGADSTVRVHVRESDVVLVTIGANDLMDVLGRDPDVDEPCPESCYGPRARAAAAGTATVVRAVHRLAPEARILVTNYWNVSKDTSRTELKYLQPNRVVTEAFDAALAAEMRNSDGELVDLVHPFITATHGDPSALLLDDLDHPSAAGHRAIADAVLQVLAHGEGPDGVHASLGDLTRLMPPTSTPTSGGR